MSGAQLDGAVFIQADLRKANLRGAGFRSALLDEANLRDARLGGTFLVGASLSGADLRGAYLRLAKLDGANLYDANLDGFDGLRRDQVNRAHCNSGTKLPVGLTGWKMSNDEHVTMLGRGAAEWNEWRAKLDETPDLSQAGLRGLDLTGFDLSRANLQAPISEGPTYLRRCCRVLI